MKGSGLIMLLLAALLVAMPAAAFTFTVDNGADALMLGTKINVQEEVGGIFTSENMIALAVVPNEELAVPTINEASEVSGNVAVYYMPMLAFDGYHNSTPGAGGDGLLARFS